MKKIRGTSKRPRLAVFRSQKAIYAQIIDDEKGKTLAAANDKEINGKGTKIEKAGLVGDALAKKALKKKIKAVIYDRRHYQYHGRVKALAEGARKGGLKF